MNFFSQNLCNPSGPDTFQFYICIRCMETSSLVMLILLCCATHSNSFSTVIIHSALVSWSTGLSHNSLQNLIDSSASGIACSCLIFPSNSSYKAFWLFLKVQFCRYCFTLDLHLLNFIVLADIRCLSSFITVLKSLAFTLYFFLFYYIFLLFYISMNLALPFFHHPLNQSSILLKSILKIAISFSILRFQNGSFLFMVLSVLTPTFSQANNALALATYLSSEKFLTGIHFSTSFTSFTYLVTKVMSLLRRVGISRFCPTRR